MWPKMLFELLPHFARLMPMADKYLSTRSASEKAQQAALAALDDSVRGELDKTNQTHADLRTQMQRQSAQVAELALDVTRVRQGVEAAQVRTAKLEGLLAALDDSIATVKAKATLAIKLLGAGLVLLSAAVALLVILVVRSGH